MATKSPSSGFTLVELMVTLAVLVILAAIAAPNFARIIAENRATSAANEFLGMLQTARSEAVRLNRLVTVEQSGANWHSGIAVVGPDNNVLRSMPAMAQELTFTSGPAAPMAFRPAGDIAARAEFQLDNAGGSDRWICVEMTGSARVAREACE